MSVFEKYPDLPGFASEFKDGGLKVRAEETPPGTESVLLLGTAIDGPVGEPVAVDPATVELVFGESKNRTGQSNGSTLVKAFHEAWAGGSRDIRLMRITGEPAKAVLEGEAISSQIETTKIETLDLSPGNIETVFTVGPEALTESTISVSANGYSLPKSAFTYDEAEKEITLREGATDVGARITISYMYIDGEESKTVTMNRDPETEIEYVANGEDVTFSLAEIPQASSLNLYANGVLINKEDGKGENNYTIQEPGKQVTLKAGVLKKGELIKATYIHAEVAVEEVKVTLESTFGGFVYNQTNVEIEDIKNSADTKVIGKKVIITKPESKKAQASEKPLEYSSIDYPTVGMFVQAINSDPRNNVLRATTNRNHEELPMQSIKLAGPFSGGDDGIHATKRELYEILGGTLSESGDLEIPGVYHLLENYTTDMIVPLGVYADDVLPGMYDNFAYQLALACAVISYRNSATIGVIATSSPDESGLAAVRDHVSSLLKHKNDYFMRDRAGNILRDRDGNNTDLGRWVSVVAGPDVVINENHSGTYAENSAAGYAGFVSQLAPQSAPTNKEAPYARGLRFTYSNTQLNNLTKERYVTLSYKENNARVMVVDGPTAAQSSSDYRRLTTIRVAKEVENEIRQVCDPYIGEPNEIPQRNAMSAAISKRLERMIEAGVIINFDFNILVTPQMQAMGEAEIELTIVPPQELRKITLVVSLSPGQ